MTTDRFDFTHANRAAAAADVLLLVTDGNADEETLALVGSMIGNVLGMTLGVTVERCAVETLDAHIAAVTTQGARAVIVPPLLPDAATMPTLEALVQRGGERWPAGSVLLADPVWSPAGIAATIALRYLQATGQGPAQNTAHKHDLGASILPPRYQGRIPSAAAMAAAPFVYDADGRVAWDRVWGGDDPAKPFCELALAGGPPQRGELLEPVAPNVAAADPEGYARVLDELARGVRQTTGLQVITTAALGWIGVVCTSEEMAIWLLRAIVVENICARRERTTLYLPAGPHFRLEFEIRNVITALAKTHHYWQEHARASGGRP